MEFFTIDYTLAIQIAKPITFEHGRAFYNNPIALFQGDPTAPEKLWIAKGGQNATATDETDTFKRLAPDGAGGTRWALPLEGSTTGLASSADHITDTLLNAGLWYVGFHNYRQAPGSIRFGHCFLLNGAILTQSMMTYDDSSGTSTVISSSQFAVSGSGASKTITATDIAGTGTGRRMTAARMA